MVLILLICMVNLPILHTLFKYDWLFLSGSTGPKGEQGPAGIQGLTGPRGQQGSKGEIGQAGKDGVDGSLGQKGERGLQGIPGSKVRLFALNIMTVELSLPRSYGI